jgi:hypothetical protein
MRLSPLDEALRAGIRNAMRSHQPGPVTLWLGFDNEVHLVTEGVDGRSPEYREALRIHREVMCFKALMVIERSGEYTVTAFVLELGSGLIFRMDYDAKKRRVFWRKTNAIDTLVFRQRQSSLLASLPR